MAPMSMRGHGSSGALACGCAGPGAFQDLLDLDDPVLTCVVCARACGHRLAHQDSAPGGLAGCELEDRPDGCLQGSRGRVALYSVAYSAASRSCMSAMAATKQSSRSLK